jgi:hypothetical protein
LERVGILSRLASHGECKPWFEPAEPYLAAVVMGLPLGRFVFVLVNWNRIQILCFKNLVAIKAADVIHPIAPV